jgi:hypothetical protein
MSGGTLTGPGELDLSGALSWSGGTMSGTGSTVVQGGGTINPPDVNGGAVTLDTRTFSNQQGTLTFASGTIRAYNGATIRNNATFNANSQAVWWGPAINASGGAAPQLINTGALQKTAGTGNTGIGVTFDNEGTVNAQTGTVSFSGGGIPPQGGGYIDDPILCPQPVNTQMGTWTTSTSASIKMTAGCDAIGTGAVISGTLNVQGATVLIGAVQGASALLYATSGTLAVEDTATPALVQNLYVSGTLTGPGEIDICGNLSWQAGTMSGTGATVICPGGTGQINPPSGTVTMNRVLDNAGTLTWSSGSVALGSGALIVHTGTMHPNAESGATMFGDGTSMVDNAGQLSKNVGSGSTAINVPVDNPGTIGPSTGTLQVQGKACTTNSNTGDDTDTGNTTTPPTPTAVPPDFNDGSQPPPGDGWTWEGKEPVGGDEGAWFNPDTRESWHPDLGHAPPVGPHWDYGVQGNPGDGWRWGSDGELTPKKSACA